ncbi:Phospholipase D [archaeon HR06]|nr:Phospholipase D [archaeon HR06]
MVYSFTLDDLANALIEAKSRGVSIKVIIEKNEAQVKGSEYQRLLNSGINIVLDGNPYLMHHKVAIIDSKIVITGSYNWTLSAEDRNNENIIIVEDKDVAKAYEEEFYRIWKEALS